MRATAIGTATGSIAFAATAPVSAESRVEYRRDGLTEWYVNGPRGLEQGFTLAAPPAGAEQFTVSLAITGDVPIQVDNGLMIGDLRYSGLMVTDAAGATLPAHLDTADGAIRIAVDATRAQWPITVDPLVTQATLTANGSTTTSNYSDLFGTSIATTTANGTTTVVIGAPRETVGASYYQGVVYVFTSTGGGTFTRQARLTCACNSQSSSFGQSVAITTSGATTTIVVGAYDLAYVFTGSGSAYTQQAVLGGSYRSNFGTSVAVAVTSATTTVAIGAPTELTPDGSASQGAVYMFAGSGTSYPHQTTILDSSPTDYEDFGISIALASSRGTNTLVVGAKGKNVNGVSAQGQALVYTGSGSTYTAAYRFNAPDADTYGAYLGQSIALATVGGVNTIVISAPYKKIDGYQAGVVYVLVGSGSTYKVTELRDRGYNYGYEAFGYSVAVQFAEGTTLVAVGAPGKQGVSNAAHNDGIILFTQVGGSFVQTDLPETGGNTLDNNGTSVAIATAPNGDVTVLGGVPTYSGATVLGKVALTSWSAAASVQPTFGDGAETVASPTNTYSGTPFHLVATLVDGLGLPLSSTGVTFTVNANGATGGRFTASDPASTTLHATTRDGMSGTTAGQTDTISLYPSSAAGSFTVTAAADGSALNTTYALTIIASAPKPTINAVIPSHAVGAATQSVHPNTVTAQPPGLSPAMVIIDTSKTYTIQINGSGFVSQALGTTAFFQYALDTTYQMDTVYVSSTELLVYVTGYNMLAGLSADTTANIQVRNPPSSPGGTDGGTSSPVSLVLVLPRPAAANSRLACSGAMNILAIQSSRLVPPPCQVVDGQGHPVPGIATGAAKGFVGIRGGELVATGAGNLVGQDGSGLVGQDGGSLVATGAGNVISNDGGTIVSHDGGSIVQSGAAKPASQSSSASAPQSRTLPSGKSTVGRNDATHPATGDYIASTDAHSIIMAPPVLSNGIPGTFTRSLSVDGIAAPITYTITNLNPHDGHPTTITALSHTGASAGDPNVPLTVTGTGFITDSVISYGGVQLVTTFTDVAHVSATIPAALLNYTGAKDVVVINPDPNGGASLPATFTVTPAETVASVKPTLVSVGQSFTLTVTGSNFVNGATVRFNGTPLTTTFVSATTLTAMVPGSLDQTVGTAQVTVVDPFGVGTNALSFTIAVVKAEPPPRPEAPPVQPMPGVQPAPAGRPAPPGAGTGPPPNPIPTGR